MGSKSSKCSNGEKYSSDPKKELRSFGDKVKDAIEEELGRRMMIQREVQMAVNIAKARDTIQIFGSAWALLTSGVVGAKIAGHKVPPFAAIPVVIGGLVLGNMADMAYGNKLARVSKEAEYILENERARLVPLKQAPVARFYSSAEKKAVLDPATAAGLLWPSIMFSRSFVPQVEDINTSGKEQS